jgi:pimeloyl-ACP methyl ester carboxylesterase
MRVAAVALALWLTVSWAVAFQLTRRAHPRFAEPVPAVAWGEFEPHRIKTRDGQDLGAWLHRGADDAPSVLLLHGNRGSRGGCLDRAAILAEGGCTVLLVSLRAHGDSTGEFNDIGYSARHDVVAAVDFLERRRPDKPVVILGSSMGAAAAVFASRDLAGRVRGYVLECPYKDLRTAVWNRTENALTPLFNWVAYQGLVLASTVVLPDLERISPVAAIEGIPADVPVLVMAGGRDRKARPHEARAIHDRVRSHSRLSVFTQADHARLHVSEPERYRREVLDFVRSVGRSHPAAPAQRTISIPVKASATPAVEQTHQTHRSSHRVTR